MKLIALILSAAMGQHFAAGGPSYRVFRAAGTPAILDDVVVAASSATVTFFGESHDDPTAHGLELELLKRLEALGPLVLTLEMFERDVQYVLDEYLESRIGEDHLIASGRAWKNYHTDYRALVEFAKERRIPVIAANAPRRYVNRVSRLGQNSLDVLSPIAKDALPPLPYAEASDRYSRKFREVMETMRKEAEVMARQERKLSEHPARRMDPIKSLAAQSLWDASMAFSIAESLMRFPRSRVLHVNGSFHSEDRLGILDHLERYRPATRSIVVTVIPHKSYPAWDGSLSGKGDFIIVTNPSLVKSSRSGAQAKPVEKK